MEESKTIKPTMFGATEDERPDYIKCVGFGDRVRMDGVTTWCGSQERPFFIDVTHAALNGRSEGRLVVCPECLTEIFKGLNNGHNYHLCGNSIKS